MKKFVLILTTIFLSQIFNTAYSQESITYNLHSGSAYVLDLDFRPMDLQVTNPRVITTGVVTDIFSTESQLVIQALEEGISYISYKSKNESYTIKILVDNNAKADESLLEIDKYSKDK